MRRALFALCLLLAAGLSSDGRAVVRSMGLAPEPVSESAPRPIVESAATAAGRPGALPVRDLQPLPRVVDVSPVGDRVEPNAPLRVRFEADVPPAARAGALSLEPPLEVRPRWTDPRTLEVEPAAWRLGRAQRARVQLAASSPVEWSFRTRVPPPAGVLPGAGARLVLTFDDGPNDRRQADRLLDRLRDLAIRVLFFPSGRWTEKRPDWVERAVAEGHRVCNHTKNHVNLTAPWMTEPRIREEIEGGARDGQCRLFRPPLMGYDARVERVAAELGYALYLWDVDSRDWEGAPAEDIENTVLRGARPDAVVLFHIHARETFEALPSLAEKLRAAGYVLSWDVADAATPRLDGVGLGRTPLERREWGAERERPTDTGLGPEWFAPGP